MGFFEKIKQGLKKTRENISHKIDLVINSFTKIDEEFFEELEEILIASDISFQTSQKICENLRSEVKRYGYKMSTNSREMILYKEKAGRSPP